MVLPSTWTKMRAATATATAAGLLLLPTIPAQAANPHPTTAIVPHFKHIFMIVMENHSYNDLMYEHDVPYLHQLAETYGIATQYYGVSNPSVADRVALLSGTTAGTELPNSQTTGLTQTNLVDQLSSHHLSWGAFYQHSRVSTVQNPIYNYQHGHSTFLRFADIATNPQRVAHLHPLRQLTSDLATNQVPNFVWIAPNSIGNMEGGYRAPGQFTFQGAGPGGATPADSQLENGGNQFLSTWIPKIMHSKAWHSGPSAIFIAFDETSYDASMPADGFWLSHTGVSGSPVVAAGTNLSGNSHFLFPGGVDGGGHTLALVITNTPHHVVSSTPYNEYSILKTIEAGWHLGYLGHAADPAVHSMSAFFGPPTHRFAAPAIHVRTLPGYDTHLKDTPIISQTGPAATSVSSVATLKTSTNPYFVQGETHQVGATVTIQENSAGVLDQNLTLTLPTGGGVTFAQHSSPVGSTRISNPSDQGVQFAPSTVATNQVTLPIVVRSTVPSEAVITGLVLNTTGNAKPGPVVATVSTGGKVLGTVTLGSVGRPAAGTEPQMMAPIVLNGQMAFPFIPPVNSSKNGRFLIRVEGQYPTSASLDLNQYALFNSVTNIPVVSDTSLEITSQAGKQYWVQSQVRGDNRASWSTPATFSVSQ